jgi:hypothetical protein
MEDVDDLLLDPLACAFRRACKQRNPCSSSASRSWTSNLNAAPISGSRSK